MGSEKLLTYDRQKVRNAFGKSEKDVLEDVQIVQNWLKSQLHLPEITNETVIEAFLITNKFSIEKTKQKLDMYYTMRSLMPEVYENANPSQPHMKETFDKLYNIALPKPTKELYRVVVWKIMVEPEDFNPDHFLAHLVNLIEVRLHEDVALGDVYILDQEHVKMGHLTKMSLMHLKRIATVVENVFSNRIKAIYIINYPPFVDLMMKLAKMVLKPKLVDRMHFHTAEELPNLLPKEILPKDYGGEEKSLQELNELWKQKVEEYKGRFDKLDQLRVNEDLRPTPLKNDDMLGYHGNFKKLDVD